jgi:hypothetical protein
LKYPVDWVEDAPQSSTTSSSLSIHPQQRQLGILFVIGRFSPETSATISSPSEINQANLQAFSGQQTVHNFQLLANSVAQRRIGGATWTEQDAGYQDSNGNSMRFTTISVQHKKTYYTIILLSPQVYYDEAMQKDIQPMFDSLQFLS